MSDNDCRAGGCANAVPAHLKDAGMCLDHFLADVEARITGFGRLLDDKPGDLSHKTTALQFILLSAARIATIGVHSPPDDQMVRGRMLHVMLMLADLRERLDATKKS
ncbi:MAG TPA: hypothetical protein VGA39_02115 [Candidatus Acidoferrales bacterium]